MRLIRIIVTAFTAMLLITITCKAQNTPAKENQNNSDKKIEMHRYIVERSFPNKLIVPADDKGADALQNVTLTNSEESVTWIHSYVTEDKKKTFCVYDAPSKEAIRKAAKANNLPVDKITEVRVLDPYFYK